ncbi:protein-disulfide reductase DsbD family protein [Roseibium porphyridii]|uniref:Protein-disulfide reductase DsbD family protein n=1 Tax=Roseibium porphyridii TaxID=2866279 RepID=A0ABY8F0I5_9HYPH|nr:protein-disulfide reductase DsbD domain-containing protein [Roseibium sp. KMA01]WFE88948.1 protein-disulfide reductase DsbD family protein [Roseibium sp. KMA01]
MKRFALFLSLAFLTALSPARAAMTDWTEVQGGAVRLIASGALKDGSYLAGLEFLMEQGWHTYWRYPGEAGIPPQITLSNTANLKDIEILYPVPERYNDGFSESIVYHDGIVLPIKVTPEDPSGEVRFSIELFFGICKDICVPGDAVLSLDFGPDMVEDKLAAKLIERDLDNVPASSGDDTLKIQNVSLSEDKKALVIDAIVGIEEQPDLFAAGPHGSFIGLPKLFNHDADTATWHLSTKGLSTQGDDRTLRLVLKSGGRATEFLQPIDPAWVE